jgi:hypothetical protein
MERPGNAGNGGEGRSPHCKARYHCLVPMPTTPLALILVPNPGDEYREDFAAIERHVHAIDAGIKVRVVHEAKPAQDLADELRGHRTLTVSFRHGVPFPVGGRVFACRYMPKIHQARSYAAARIPLPRSRVFEWNLRLDPALWGRFVVLKPMRPGTMSNGAVQVMPTAMVEQLSPLQFDARHPIRHGPMLVQSFVDTGARPTCYRVLTLLGEPLYAMAIVLKQPRPEFDAAAPLPEFLAVAIATNSGPRDRIMTNDPEILAFARRMSSALPDVPLQGLDIVRERRSGRLFAIESNPGGNTWHFSSRAGAKMRGEMGNGREILLGQFGALEVAARALVQAVRDDRAPQ